MSPIMYSCGGCLRVPETGGHYWRSVLLVRIIVWRWRLRDAGFEIRDSIHWTYGLPHRRRRRPHPDGWKRRNFDITTGDTIAQWDPADGISPSPVLDTYRTPGTVPLSVTAPTPTNYSPPTTASTTRSASTRSTRRHRLPRNGQMKRVKV